MILSDKVVWITGASSGIGEATAYELAKKNVNLIISSNQKKELEEVKNKCEKIGTKCYSIPFDLLETNKIPEIVTKAYNCFGKIDILFNNGNKLLWRYFVD